jgi:hypothetical protein
MDSDGNGHSTSLCYGKKPELLRVYPDKTAKAPSVAGLAFFLFDPNALSRYRLPETVYPPKKQVNVSNCKDLA